MSKGREQLERQVYRHKAIYLCVPWLRRVFPGAHQ
jgi:hypothetical protein